ncbi:hypothetical protein H8959_006015, partial [Pygathrix nigripes]
RRCHRYCYRHRHRFPPNRPLPASRVRLPSPNTHYTLPLIPAPLPPTFASCNRDAQIPSSPARSGKEPESRLLSFQNNGTGTFGWVHLVKEKAAKHFFALKVMSIPDVIRLKQEQHVHNEKSVLKEVSHPFLIRLFWTWHDERFLYMLMGVRAGRGALQLPVKLGALLQHHGALLLCGDHLCHRVPALQGDRLQRLEAREHPAG